MFEDYGIVLRESRKFNVIKVPEPTGMVTRSKSKVRLRATLTVEEVATGKIVHTVSLPKGSNDFEMMRFSDDSIVLAFNDGKSDKGKMIQVWQIVIGGNKAKAPQLFLKSSFFTKSHSCECVSALPDDRLLMRFYKKDVSSFVILDPRSGEIEHNGEWNLERNSFQSQSFPGAA
jgi:hypothetical protein